MKRFHAKSWCVPHDTPLPPPPPGVRYVRVRLLGIVIADDELRAHVRRRFHWPMIILALMILPLLALELWSPPERWTPLWWLSLAALTIIWVAFFIEFVIKVSIAESRFEYVRKNWLDLIVLALPALRPLRVAYVARTSRVFALRGVGMKFAKYVITVLIGLEATERLLERFGIKAVKGRRKPEEMTRHQLIDEIKRLRRLTDAWQEWHEAHEEFAREQGVEVFGIPTPPEAAAARGEPADDAPPKPSDAESMPRDDGVGDASATPTIAPACRSPSPN